MNARASLLLLVWIAASCASATPPTPVAAPAPPQTPQSPPPSDMLNSVAWMQTAAEYQASALQAFAVARAMLDRALADPKWTAAQEQTGEFASLPPAVIVDIDETMLDNSPYEVRRIRLQKSFDSESWKKWVFEAVARPVPGALEFARYAKERGVTVFYVSGRTAEEEPPTRENLRRHGFPIDESIDVVPAPGERPEWKSDKSTRRAHIASTHRILLLVGDDFRDFTSEAIAPLDERNAAVQKHRERWGREWIVIPNPMYGSWERALIGTGDPLPEEEKRRRKLERLDAKE